MFKQRLKTLREQKGLSQTEFADALGVAQSTVGGWESGARKPNLEIIDKIAEFFGVSCDYILGRVEYENFEPAITEDYVTFPIIGDVAAGYEHVALEDWSGETIDIPRAYLKGRKKEDYFVLKVVGDSMFPQYQEGDKVLVLKQSTLNYSGQIGVMLYADDNATLKKVEYKKGEDWMRLIAINPSIPPIRIDGEALEHCRVLGIPRLLIREICD